MGAKRRKLRAVEKLLYMYQQKWLFFGGAMRYISNKPESSGQSKKGLIMNTSNTNVLKGDFDRRSRESNAAQYIALKQYERAEDRQFIWDGFMISAVIVIGVMAGLVITLILGAQ